MELNRLKVVLIEKNVQGNGCLKNLKRMKLLFLVGVQMNLNLRLKLFMQLPKL